MAATWHEVKVFISSTFSDMHSERDYLIKFVFPSLREKLEKLRIHLVDIDLRWGVTGEQADNDQALDLCLKQINECRPFFLGILGERYGYVPKSFNRKALNKYGWIQQQTGKSITELEILYGVLRKHEMQNRAFFYFRDKSFITDVPESKQKDILSKEKETDKNSDKDSSQKLEDLKQEIRDAKPPVPVYENYPCSYQGLKINWRLARTKLDKKDQTILQDLADDGIVDSREYNYLNDKLKEFVDQHSVVYLKGLKEFGDRIENQLEDAILNPEPESELFKHLEGLENALDPLAEEADYHERFMESRLRVFVGRNRDRHDLASFANDDDEVACLVTGPPGSGKSALLARFVTDYRDNNPDVFTIPHFIGSSSASSDLLQMLRRFCRILKIKFDFQLDIPDDETELPAIFRTYLTLIPENQKMLLVIDALNQMDDFHQAHELHWLLEELPPHVKLIVSCTTPTCPDPAAETILEQFGKRMVYSVEVQPLNNQERRQIIHDVPSLSAKALGKEQLDLLLSNPATENPLFLLVALEELRGFGSFEELDLRIATLPRTHEEGIPAWQQWLVNSRSIADALADDEKKQKRLKQLNHVQELLNQVSAVDDPVSAIFLQVIDRLKFDFGPEITKSVLSLMASARRGLSENELKKLVEASKQADNLFPLLRQLRTYMFHRANLLDFYHASLNLAVKEHYLKTQEKKNEAHRRLAEYFQQQKGLSERKLDELPWQLCEVEEWQRLYNLLADINFFTACWKADEFDAKRYWSKLESSSHYRMIDAYQLMINSPEKYDHNKVWGIATLLSYMGHTTSSLSLQTQLVDYFRHTGDYESLSAALSNQSKNFHTTGKLDEAMKLLREKEIICRRQNNIKGLSSTYGGQSVIHIGLGELDEAMRLLNKQEEICREIGNKEGLATCLGNQGVIYKTRGNLNKAMQLHIEQERIYRETGNKDGLATCFGNQALIFETKGDLDEALHLLKKQENICIDLGYIEGIRLTLGNQASILHSQGQLNEAMKLNKQVEQICTDSNNLVGLSLSLVGQAMILTDWRKDDKAMQLYKRAEKICRDIGNKDGLSMTLNNQSMILKNRGELSEAMELMKEDEKICRDLKNRDGLSYSLGNQALIHKAWGNLDKAMSLHQEQEQICREIESKRGLSISLGNQALIHKMKGNLDEALRSMKEDEDICRDLKNKDGLQRSLGNQASIFYSLDNFDKALQLYNEKEQICREINNLNSLVNALHDQAIIFEKMGDLEKSFKTYKEEEIICREIVNIEGIATSMVNQALLLANEFDRVEEALPLVDEAYQLVEKHNLENLKIKIRSVLDQINSSLKNKSNRSNTNPQLDKKKKPNTEQGQNFIGYEELFALLEKEALALMDLGDHEEALRLYKELENISRKSGDKDGLSISFCNQAAVHVKCREYDEAMKLMQIEEQICREIGNTDGLIMCLKNQANVFCTIGELGEGFKIFTIIENISRKTQNVDDIVFSLSKQTLILQRTGELKKAIKTHNELEKICRKIGNFKELSNSLGNHANILAETKKPKKAMKLYKEQQELCQKMNDMLGLSNSLGNQGITLAETGKLEEAMVLFKKKEKICRDLGDKNGLSNCLSNIANIFVTKGEVQNALPILSEEAALCRETSNSNGLLRSLNLQAYILRNNGLEEKAIHLHNEKEHICRDIGDIKGLSESLVDQAILIANKNGNVKKALPMVEEAYVLAVKSGLNNLASQIEPVLNRMRSQQR